MTNLLNGSLFPGRQRAACVLALFCLLAVAGCGKEGWPEPTDPGRSFSWREVSASGKDGCIAFTGVLEGAVQNLDAVRLELAAVDGADDCPGCPFVPREILSFTPEEAGVNRDLGEFGFSYCPGPAMAYRWRLTGVNRYTRLPHAITAVRLLIME